MKKTNRVSKKTAALIDPFGKTAYKTERSAVAVLMHWMRNILQEKNISLGAPDVETSGADRKMPDLVIYDSPACTQVLCVIEAKPPYFNVYDFDELIKPARKKANKRKAKYFATTNFKSLVWFDTAKANEMLPEQEQIINIYDLAAIENLEEIEYVRYSESIKRAIEQFLLKLYTVSTGKEPLPKLPIDDRLVRRLQETIRVLSRQYYFIINDNYHKDKEFKKNLNEWLKEQNWNFHKTREEYEQIARQAAYLLINKILFYNLLQPKWPNKLDPIDIPKTVTLGYTLRSHLVVKFDYIFQNINYETIFTTDFIDIIALPDSEDAVKEIKALCNVLKRYDFSTIGYDIIGRIFERLIPKDERHKLGQFFTRSDVVDLILNFCISHEDAVILDPGCGAGTFLKRAYQQKKLMNNRLQHEKLLETLWGNDIAKFPAMLTTINLAINDLSVDKNYPNVIHEDFFAIKVSNLGVELDTWRKKRAQTLGKDVREIEYPRHFDAIVGNPPYTRQEEIEEMGVEKKMLIENALIFDDKPLARLSKRAGIFAYFFIHGTKFLKDGGYFGFIVSNSWLDVDYGKGLQEHFLNYYKIVAIIDSKVERWFVDADINTCIVILQKCADKIQRDNNLVRFVYLKQPLAELIPPAEDDYDQELARKREIDKIKDVILAHDKLYENDDMRIFPIKQNALWDEGFDRESETFQGAKWGKYLRAPEIFFKILDKGKDKLVPLKEIADVRFGIKTGANEFFYLTEGEIKRRKIERAFWKHKDENGNWVPNYVIRSPRDCDSIYIDPDSLNDIVLIINKKKQSLEKKRIFDYIIYGEKMKFNKRPTCASRANWYDLGNQKPPDILWFKAFNDKFLAPVLNRKYFSSDRFYALYLKNVKFRLKLAALLNSTFLNLIIEIWGKSQSW